MSYSFGYMKNINNTLNTVRSNPQIKKLPGKSRIPEMKNSVEQKKLSYPASRSGFTLPEMLAVLIILAIIAAVAASRVDGLWTTAYGDADRLAADLRYARSLAMTQVPEQNQSGVTLQINENGWEFTDTRWRFPDGKTERETRWGVSINTERSVTFKYPLGNPDSTSNIDLLLSKGGSNITIRVHNQTGYVEILD